MTIAALYWLFALALTVHNIEEGLFLPAFTASVPRLSAYPTPFSFRFALVLFTGAAYVLVAVAAAGDALATHALAGLAVVMAVNAVMPHLLLTVLTRRYAPGTLTGVFIMLPLSLLLSGRLLADGTISGSSLALSAMIVAVAVIAALSGLFLAGRFIERHLPQALIGGT